MGEEREAVVRNVDVDGVFGFLEAEGRGLREVEGDVVEAEAFGFDGIQKPLEILEIVLACCHC